MEKNQDKNMNKNEDINSEYPNQDGKYDKFLWESEKEIIFKNLIITKNNVVYEGDKFITIQLSKDDFTDLRVSISDSCVKTIKDTKTKKNIVTIGIANNWIYSIYDMTTKSETDKIIGRELYNRLVENGYRIAPKYKFPSKYF